MPSKGYIKNKIGEKYLTKEGYEVNIIECFKGGKYTIQFNDKNRTIVKNVTQSILSSGSIKNPYHKSVCGVGYIGVGKYNIWVNDKPTIEYTKWRHILVRCNNVNYQNKKPTYKHNTVCEEWHNFQNFAKWFEENWKPWMDKTWHIDKDILVKGNKIYSPDTCCFVHQDINSLFIKRDSKRGNYMIGVTFHKRDKVFVSQVNKGKGHTEHIGYFKTEIEAFNAYKEAKEEYIKEVADKWKDKITDKVYKALYNYKVEITD